MQTLFRNLRLSAYISVLVVLAVVASTIQFFAAPARAADDNPNDYVTALAQARTLGVGISPDDKTYNDAIGVGAATQERHKDTPDGQELKDGPNLLTFGDHEVIDLGDVAGQPGIPIPLLKTETTPGLLSLGSYSGVQGSVGVAESRVSTVNQYHAKAGAGLLNDDGSLIRSPSLLVWAGRMPKSVSTKRLACRNSPPTTLSWKQNWLSRRRR